jgi:PIN domain nuclease of toxin-antitoxin system
MKLLLDTHVFLWYITDDAHLAPEMAAAIREASNDVYLSVVSVWEALVKHRLGKLPMPSPADDYIRDRREKHQITSLGLEEEALGHLLSLPDYHRDPFDRMLICQALHNDMVIVTVDRQISKYPVRTLATS